ncbi:MAG: Uma2 family endonuclease [Bryobacteraceae bacterium]
MSAAAQQALVDSGMPPRKRITRAEYHRMIDAGVFVDQRVELVNGELIDKMSQKPPHIRTIRHLTASFAAFCSGGRLQVQGPIEISTPGCFYSEPEPDLCILGGDVNQYHDRLARGDEVLLAVEVSDSTARYDLSTKRDLYARGGVPEYWVLDLNLRRVIVHRALQDGAYSETTTFSAGETVAPQLLAGASFRVEDLLPE